MVNLADAFCARNGDIIDPFEPLTIVVQSLGLGQWLKLRLADQFGIATNVDAVLPATFLWRLYRTLIPDTAHLETSPFDREQLVWRVMRLLDQNPDLSPALSHYLNSPGDPDLRRFQLSSEITLLFDEYLMYRPEWMLEWTEASARPGQAPTGDHAEWQSGLWRLIIEDAQGFEQLHRAALHRSALSRLAANQSNQSPLVDWPRISIFGLSTMPEIQLQTFEALAEHTEVDLYFLNPCEHYWGDIISAKDKARRSIRTLVKPGGHETLTDEDYLEVGNPLLSSLGKQAREYLELLLSSDRIQTFEFFTRFPETTALNRIKNDVLDMTFAGEFGNGCAGEPFSNHDSSIQVHSCHSRLREVEVLHDEILRALTTTPELKLSDIIVMVPDIADYAPFVSSVFGDSLNHRVADLGSLADSPLLDTFMTLLGLPDSRLTGPQVMDLLETPAVMRRFDLDASELEKLSHWVSATGIRWEVNGGTKQAMWDLPPENQNTWQFGLDRLLLGFAMTPDQGPWQSVLPYSTSTSEAELISKLHNVINQLQQYRERLGEAKSIIDWQVLLPGMIKDFMSPTGDEELEIDLLHRVVDGFTQHADLAGFNQPVSREMLAEAFGEALAGDQSRAGFISGGITFATLVPMRSIPFKMICLLGMNDGDYPREKRPHSFDLISVDKPRRGDRSKRLDDRYLFLEALLSAQDCFYVSYVGRGIRDDKVRPPSVVITEWRYYLDQVLETPPFVQHALQPFNPVYYQGDERQSFEQKWYEALQGPTTAEPFISSPLPINQQPDRHFTPVELAAFFRHPGRYFMQQRLGVYLDDTSVDLKDTEAFELDQLESYQLADGALSHLVAGRALADYRDWVLATGQVLAGPVGQQHLDRELQRGQGIYAEVAPRISGTPVMLDTTLHIDEICLDVRASNLFDNGQNEYEAIRYRAGQLNSRHLLEDWIHHLAINSAGQSCYTISIARGPKDDAKVTTLRPVSAQQASEQLTVFIRLFQAGMLAPLFLPPRASHKYSEARFKGDGHELAILRTRQDWETDKAGNEGSDRYWPRLFDISAAFESDFPTQAMNIWTPLLEHVES